MREHHYPPERCRDATGELGDPRVAGGSAASLRRARGGSCGGVPGLADGTEEFVAGSLNGLGGVEVGGWGGEPVERFEGDSGPEEAFGAGHCPEALVGGGDILLPVAPLDAAVGAGDLGGEEAGPVEVEEGAEAALEEVVDLGDEGVGTWTWPSHRRTMLPFLDSTRALSFERRGRDFVKVSMWSLLRRSATSRLTYSEPLSA